MTAEQFLDQYINKSNISWSPEIDVLYGAINTAMIEFAKHHVTKALQEIAEDYTYYLEGDEGSEKLNKNKFHNEAYPLTNIQ
jgi:hypothetical protein